MRFIGPPDRCTYLPEQVQRLEFEWAPAIGPDEYGARLLAGWRRFGTTLFRPRCRACSACTSVRVDVARFRPDRSQRRARKANEGAVRLDRGVPAVSRARLDLYRRYHDFQAVAKGWSPRSDEAGAYAESFVENPFPTEEWRYTLGGRLVGIGYVDALAAGLSAIYFFYDPDLRDRSLGTWNVLCLIDRARDIGLSYVYLGYYVAGCPSLSYKARFAPNQALGPDGIWRDFRA